eukprot:GILJ01004780.1.p1 GENE.GILJ01004780.1~~GILJ01004780.1.p1  ORF type:complete len:547 (+),score=77.25 GILJ01004780.1:42-1643(+)
MLLCSLGLALLLGVAVAAQPVVNVDSGTVQGFERDGAHMFLGIPFAEPPINENRFQSPKRLQAWSGVRVADKFSPACLQLTPTSPATAYQSEDCLYLNVFVPKIPDLQLRQSKLPVMVYIHGGSFTHGSGSEMPYSQPNFAVREGVIVVTVNYRLGPFGYFLNPSLATDDYKTSSNYATLDQLAALEWVQRNIESFGGDKNSVTVFGESAGAISICLLLVLKQSAGLFKRAIMESGTCTAGHPFGRKSFFDKDVIMGKSSSLASAVGCTDPNALPACIRAVPASVMLNHSDPDWAPAHDGVLFTKDPLLSFVAGEFLQDVDIMSGHNKDEGTVFVRQDLTLEQWRQLGLTQYGAEGLKEIEKQYPPTTTTPWDSAQRAFGDFLFVCSNYRMLKLIDAVQQTVSHGKRSLYGYYFTYAKPEWTPCPSPVCHAGVFHAVELWYLFGIPFQGIPFADNDLAFVSKMQNLWASFAKTGRPSSEGIEWAEFRKESRWPTLRLDATPVLQSDPYAEVCAFWDAHTPLAEPLHHPELVDL